MSTEEESAMQVTETMEPVKESTTVGNSGNGNFVVLDTAGDSEDSDKEEKTVKDVKEKSLKTNGSDSGKPVSADSNAKPGTSTPRLRKKPKAPVVDVNSLRKRKWQLKVYPLHAEDLQLNYMSILCKLASESLLYIPSEGRHGKAELYVATQKETATIIGKLLRMEFHHKLLSIEVSRKDTGGKEDGDESKKECKAFLMFDKFLSKKIFDARGEKGTLIEKIVTLNKLPKAATKDFIGALFPFATDIEIIESDNPDERKATVKCKTPVTSLLVYKSFKRLEINDVHVKLTIDDTVKAITLPPMFFIPPPEKSDIGPADSIESLNQSSLPRRPMMTFLNRRVLQIKRRALMTRPKFTNGPPILRNQRPHNGLLEQFGQGPRGPGPHRPFPKRNEINRFVPNMNNQGPGSRDYLGGPGRRRMIEKQNDRRLRDNEDPRDRNVSREMMQLQTQLNQAIKNQIAMLSTTQPDRSHVRHNFAAPGPSHRAPLLGHGPRQFNAAVISPITARGGMDHHNNPEFGGGSWTADHSGRIDRGNRNERERTDRDRQGVGRVAIDRTNANRPERAKRIDLSARPDRVEGNRDRGDRSNPSERARPTQRGPRVSQTTFGGNAAGDATRGKGERASLNRSERSSTRGRGTEYPGTGRSTQRNDGGYSAGSHGQATGSSRYNDYNSQPEGDNSYYRRY